MIVAICFHHDAVTLISHCAVLESILDNANKAVSDIKERVQSYFFKNAPYREVASGSLGLKVKSSKRKHNNREGSCNNTTIIDKSETNSD